MLKCGLLGGKLPHSYSPMIHGMLGDYDYSLFEKEEDKLQTFLESDEWDGLNVTIPYKKAVIPFLSSLSDTARAVGSVNTIVRNAEGELFGDNTDVYGFMEMVRHSGIFVEDKKVLVLGSGGASQSVVYALRIMNARPIVISRSGEDNYSNLNKHSDAEIIVNTTPVGMYPNVEETPLDIGIFPKLSGVLDIIYNPSKTTLLLQAEKLSVPSENGLYMLVTQAKRSSEIFTGKNIEDGIVDRIFHKLEANMKNIVLIGMPGVGKSTIARIISKKTGRVIVDSDDEIVKRYKRTPEEIITNDGEEAFRLIEEAVLRDIGKQSGLVLSTGGGAVTRENNYDSLHRNGTIVWLKRDISTLEDSGRPLSQKIGIEKLYEQREPMYRRFADYIVELENDLENAACAILDCMKC